MMLSPNAMHQPVTGLRNVAIPESNAANTPYIRACRSSKKRDMRMVEISGSLT